MINYSVGLYGDGIAVDASAVSIIYGVLHGEGDLIVRRNQGFVRHIAGRNAYVSAVKCCPACLLHMVSVYGHRMTGLNGFYRVQCACRREVQVMPGLGYALSVCTGAARDVIYRGNRKVMARRESAIQLYVFGSNRHITVRCYRPLGVGNGGGYIRRHISGRNELSPVGIGQGMSGKCHIFTGIHGAGIIGNGSPTHRKRSLLTEGPLLGNTGSNGTGIDYGLRCR